MQDEEFLTTKFSLITVHAQAVCIFYQSTNYMHLSLPVIECLISSFANLHEHLLHGRDGHTKAENAKLSLGGFDLVKEIGEGGSGGCREDEREFSSNVSHLLGLGNK